MHLFLGGRDKLRKDGILYFSARDIVCVVLILFSFKRGQWGPLVQSRVVMLLESPPGCSEHRPTQHLLSQEIPRALPTSSPHLFPQSAPPGEYKCGSKSEESPFSRTECMLCGPVQNGNTGPLLKWLQISRQWPQSNQSNAKCIQSGGPCGARQVPVPWNCAVGVFAFSKGCFRDMASLRQRQPGRLFPHFLFFSLCSDDAVSPFWPLPSPAPSSCSCTPHHEGLALLAPRLRHL